MRDTQLRPRVNMSSCHILSPDRERLNVDQAAGCITKGADL